MRNWKVEVDRRYEKEGDRQLDGQRERESEREKILNVREFIYKPEKIREIGRMGETGERER